MKGKEKEKIENYQYLKRELKRIWKLSRIAVVPVIIGTVGTVSKGYRKVVSNDWCHMSFGIIADSVFTGYSQNPSQSIVLDT